MTNQSKIPKETKDLLYENPEVIKFILDFFNVRIGKRCRTRNIIGWKPFYYLDKFDAKRLYESQEEIDNYKKRRNLTDINLENIMSNLYFGDINYYMEYIYDSTIQTDKIYYGNDHAKHINNHIIGLSTVFDIDSPAPIGPDGKEDVLNRVDFFTVIDSFNEYLKEVYSELNKRKIRYNTLFSGNGIHIITESFYPEEHNLPIEKVFEYNEKFVILIKNINYRIEQKHLEKHSDEKENKENFTPVSILKADKRRVSWNRFFKIPLTFHATRNRISIPLKNELLDKDWLKYVTDLENIKKDPSIVNEIIKKSEWNSDKIW